jgi:hypothetical protein
VVNLTEEHQHLLQLLGNRYAWFYTDIEQVLKEKKSFILRCMPSDLKVMQGRSPTWNRCALNVSII